MHILQYADTTVSISIHFLHTHFLKVSADPRLKLHGFADNLFLLSRALHSALLINHVAQVWYGDDTYSFSKRDLIIVNFVS